MVKKIKSAKYPKQDFDSTLEFVRELNQNYSNRLISYKEVEEVLGLKTNATAKFSKNVSTASQFGLITLKSGTVQITELGMHILNPIDDDIQQLKIKSLLSSSLYKELFERFKDSSLPTAETLSNILLNEYKIINTVKLQAAKFFLDSLNQLGMQKDGKIVYRSDDFQSESQKEIMETSEYTNNISESKDMNKNTSKFYKISVPLSGNNAQLIIPNEILEDKTKVQLLKNLIIANLDVFINVETEVKSYEISTD